MKDKPSVISITGKVPGGEDILLQSVYPLGPLKQSLSIHLANALKSTEPLTVKALQDILSSKAQDVEELKSLSFEPNQRVSELIVLVSLVATVNQLNTNRGSEHNNFIPAWQKAGQGPAVESFTKKESWDGFMYEHVPLSSDNPDLKVTIVPIEVKSLMIDPIKEKVTSLNDLLNGRMSKFSKYFQSEGSIGAVLVLPYPNTSTSKMTFDLKNATFDMNSHVSNGVVSAIVFLDFKSKSNMTYVSTMTYLVHKNPALAENGNMDEIGLFRLKLCNY